MSRERSPRRLGGAVRAAVTDVSPPTLLAAVQAAWPGVAGEAVRQEASPVAEHDGVVTIACHRATWAQELDLMQEVLLNRLNASLATAASGARAPWLAGQPVRALRFTADAARGSPPRSHFST